MGCPPMQDWCGVVGDTITKRVQMLREGDPWPLAGAVVESQVRAAWSAADVLVTAVVTPVDAAGGVFDLTYDLEDARAAVAGDDAVRCVYDVQVTPDGGGPVTIRRGYFVLFPDATRG